MLPRKVGSTARLNDTDVGVAVSLYSARSVFTCTSSKSRPTHLTGMCASTAHFCSRPHFDRCDRTLLPIAVGVLLKLVEKKPTPPCVLMAGRSSCAAPPAPA